MIRALVLASLLIAADDTYTVTVTVSSMRWGQKCGEVVVDGLKSLDRDAQVKRGKYIENKGIGTYTVTLPKRVRFAFKNIYNAINTRYVIDRIQVRIEGELSRDDEGLWLVSGDTRLKLRNPRKKDEKDTPPDLLAKLDEALKAGKTSYRIEGDVSRHKEATIVYLETIEAVEKKK